MATKQVLGYRGLHNWVECKLGRPKKCENCGDTSKRRYQWANKSGQYKQDINDWQRLCVPCHMKKDKLRLICKFGHPIAKNNLYINPRGHRFCRTCKKETLKAWRLNRRRSEIV